MSGLQQYRCAVFAQYRIPQGTPQKLSSCDYRNAVQFQEDNKQLSSLARECTELQLDVTEELPPPRPPLRLLLLHGAAAIFEIVRRFAVIEWLDWLQRHIGDVGNNRRHLGEKGKKRSTISFRRVCSQLCRRRLRFSHIV